MFSRDERTAHHEAGHAVARLVLLGEAAGIALNDGEGPVLGWAGGDPGDPAPTLADFAPEKCREAAAGKSFERCFHEAVCTEAGSAAVRLLHGNGFCPRGAVSGGDVRLTAAYAEAAFTGELARASQAMKNAFSALAFDCALHVLGRFWPAVMAVARALIARRRITGEEVAALVYSDAVTAEIFDNLAKEGTHV